MAVFQIPHFAMEHWASLASVLGAIAFCQTIFNALLPAEFQCSAATLIRRASAIFSGYCYFDIMEMEGVNTNELYDAVHLYLGSAIGTASGSRITLTRAVNSSAVTCSLSSNDMMIDTFAGVQLQWIHNVTQRQSQAFSWLPMPEEKRGYTLKMKKKHRQLVLNPYLDHIMEKAEDIRRRCQDRQLYTNSRGGQLDSRSHPWESVPFKHPSTFQTLAMDPVKKKEIMDDLDDFSNGQSFYQKTGRAWKRGYLLYGPPGTGKSSLIAAMANYLEYDIYDLELSEVQTNSELRKLLMKTCSKSIIVIEDIDCSINLGKRSVSSEKKTMEGKQKTESRSVTLSGLLNFTDGLWSSCGSERIFVFTTNFIEKLDPALLRSGRMDMHIHMSYCDYSGLKILAQNYLGVGEEDDDLMKQIEMVVAEARMSPADVSEALLRNRRDKRKALVELLEALRRKAERKGRSLNEAGDEEREGDDEQEKRALEIPKEDARSGELKCDCDFEEDDLNSLKEKDG